MSEYEFKIEMIQLTPLIQFQYEQEGAMLRATELKPKLDRFLIKKLIEEKSDKLNKFYIDKNNSSALAYNVSIFNPNNIKDVCKKINEPYDRLYFAAKMDDNNVVKEMIIPGKNISIKLFSFNKELICIIKKYLNEFFVSTNFGSRQSKGFGGFATVDTDVKEFEAHCLNHFKSSVVLKYKDRCENYNKAFSIIARDYKVNKDSEGNKNNFYKTIETVRKPSPIMFKYFDCNIYAIFKGKPDFIKDDSIWNSDLKLQDFLNKDNINKWKNVK